MMLNNYRLAKPLLYPAIFLIGVLIDCTISLILYLQSEYTFYNPDVLYLLIYAALLFLISLELFRIKKNWNELKKETFYLGDILRTVLKKILIYLLVLLVFYFVYLIAEWNLYQKIDPDIKLSPAKYFVVKFFYCLFMHTQYVFFSVSYPIYLFLSSVGNSRDAHSSQKVKKHRWTYSEKSNFQENLS